MGGTGPIYISAKGGEMEVKKSVLAEEAKCRAEKIKRKKSCWLSQVASVWDVLQLDGATRVCQGRTETIGFRYGF